MDKRYNIFIVIGETEFFIPTTDEDKGCSQEEASEFCSEMINVECFSIGIENGYLGIPKEKKKDVYFIAKEI